MNSSVPSGHTVLVVEDQRILLDILHGALAQAGFTPTAVDRGAPALALLNEQCFDVLVVDADLPDINGLQLCVAARERYQERIAILVIGGHTSGPRAVTALELGADDFLHKPFHLIELTARIESKLRRALRP